MTSSIKLAVALLGSALALAACADRRDREAGYGGGAGRSTVPSPGYDTGSDPNNPPPGKTHEGIKEDHAGGRGY